MEQRLPSWSERPEIIAYLLNPAFCATVLRVGMKGYSQESKRTTPISIAYLLVPLVLHKPTRDRLPRSVRTHFYAWIDTNPEIKIDLDKRITGMVPFTKEALMFLLNRRLIEFDNSGSIRTAKFKDPDLDENNELSDIFKKARLLGRLIGRSGTITSTYALLGIKP